MARRVVLATDSLDPSGMGEHMLALARGLKGTYDITLALMPGAGTDLLSRAARMASPSNGSKVLKICGRGYQDRPSISCIFTPESAGKGTR